MEFALGNLDSIKQTIEEFKKENNNLRIENVHLINVIREKKYEKIYFPKSKDKVDEAIAYFINSYPDRPRWEQMNVSFLQVSKGIYQCGYKRVHAKLNEQGKVLIKSGSNYQPIDEFCLQHSLTEKSKAKLLKKRNSGKNLSMQIDDKKKLCQLKKTS